MADISLDISDPCSGLLCLVDKHTAETLIGSGITLVIALSGWAWALTSGWRERRRFGETVRETVDDLLQAAQPMTALGPGDSISDVKRIAHEIHENPLLPTVDYLVDNVPLERWPSVRLYVAVRYVRDRIKVFIARTDRESSAMTFMHDTLPVLVRDIEAAISRYKSAG